MSRLRLPLLVAIVLGSALACRNRSLPESELLEAAGASALAGWRCKPEGPPQWRAGFRRGQWCIVEQRTPELQSATTERRDAHGQLMIVTRTWSATDSAAWTQVHDSVTAAITAGTRTARRCQSDLSSQDSVRLRIGDKPYHMREQIWRLPDYDLALSTSTPKPWARPKVWSMTVEANRYPFLACGDRPRPGA